MPASTTKMLRVMQSSISSPAEESTEVHGALTIDVAANQPQLTPSPSMVDVLNCCLSPNKKPENTPLR